MKQLKVGVTGLGPTRLPRRGVGGWLAAWRGFKRAEGQSVGEGDTEVGAVSVSLSTSWLL